MPQSKAAAKKKAVAKKKAIAKKKAVANGTAEKWVWDQPDPSNVTVSGDLSAVFKNTEVKTPGIFEVNHPGDVETLLAREATQNSWDAAIEQAGDSKPNLDLTFEFLTLEGQQKEDFATALGLGEMSLQAEAAGGWHKVVEATDAKLSPLSNEATSLNVLKVTESGTTGMGGPWLFDYSKMYLALITVGYTVKKDGSGGSFGQGKAGLITTSTSKTVVAYSCFKEHPDDPGVTRRLLGVNYWKPYRIDNESYTGWGRFGDLTAGGSPVPFVNEDADRVAESLGMEIRDGHLGTTFLLIEPSVEPQNLLEAIERNWWPAIVDQDGFDATVVQYDGKVLFPKPKNNDHLKAFIRCYELAKASGDGKNTDERFYRLAKKKLLNRGGREAEQGRLALIAQPDDWTWPYGNDNEGGVNHRSLVALIRNPRMCVEYFVTGNSAPYIRGVFIADDEINELLRQTEPALHDAWNPGNTPDGADSDAPAVAKSVISAIRNRVGKFRGELRPPAADRTKMRLPELEKHWKQLFKGGKDRNPPPPAPPSEISISAPGQAQDVSVCEDDNSKIQMSTPVRISLTDNVEEDQLAVAVTIEYRFVEDQRAGSAEDSKCHLTALKMPTGFQQHPVTKTTYTGTLEKGAKAVVFQMKSDPYDPDYVGRLIVKAERLTPELQQSLNKKKKEEENA